MKFLFDVSISFRIAKALASLLELDHRVETVEDFTGDRATKDEDFLPRLKAEGGWIVITRDLGRKDGNWHVWLNSGVTVFFLKTGWASLTGTDMAARLLKYWERIEREAAGAEEGAGFLVSTDGRIESIGRRKKKRR